MEIRAPVSGESPLESSLVTARTYDKPSIDASLSWDGDLPVFSPFASHPPFCHACGYNACACPRAVVERGCLTLNDKRETTSQPNAGNSHPTLQVSFFFGGDYLKVL